MTRSSPAFGRTAGAIVASAALAALYARGGAAWMLGFIFLVPWLRSLDASATLAATLLRAWCMSVAYTAAAFAWFGVAFGLYAQIGAAAGVTLLLLGAPLLQPQFIVFALVRYIVRARHGAVLGALAGAAAWVATEWLVPRLLGDTLGYGLYPSRLLRQGAAVGGAAGLTVLLLLSNEALSGALARRRDGLRAMAQPLALAALAPLLLGGYGHAVLPGDATTPSAKPLRIGLIQSNIVAYERQRQERGAQAVVRDVLDTHFAMSYDAVVRQGAQAVMWPETAYPTTFGNPKSAAGADFDREILDIVNAAGVPFVFGTYDRDSAGEYNAAAFVSPSSGLLGFYRKTRLFPLTEYVPAWLDGAATRRLIPWAGNWRAGNGAGVLPLRLADGREIPVLPLICRDAVDTGLAIDGARLGAQAILTMSNDSWFSAAPLGAELHQTVAAFRSIETRLPQFRVTTNGFSAVIDATGTILAGTRMGERTLVIADVAIGTPAPTLMVLWGDWVGRAACAWLIVLTAWSAMPARPGVGRPETAIQIPATGWSATVAVMPPTARLVAGLLQALSRAGLLWMCLVLLQDDSLRTNTLAQVRMFCALFLAPAAAAWCVMFVFSAKVTVAEGKLVLSRGAQHLALAIDDIAAMQLWSMPLPAAGITLQLAGPVPVRYQFSLARPNHLAAAIAAAGGPPLQQRTRMRAVLQAYVQAGLANRRSRLDAPFSQYVLLPLALAIPAFHLQQQIAYGGALGEYYTYGLKAYLTGFAIWWAAWSIGVVLAATLLRTAIDTGTMLAVLVQPGRAVAVRQRLERFGHAALFIGLPVWLAVTVYGT